MKTTYLISTLVIVISGCSSISNKFDYPININKYSNDTVTVQTAVNLAKQSYLKGCVDKSKEYSKEKTVRPCLLKADDYIRENIIFILDQDGKDLKR